MYGQAVDVRSPSSFQNLSLHHRSAMSNSSQPTFLAASVAAFLVGFSHGW